MKYIEIKGVGKFEIKHNYLHRGINPRVVTRDKGVYKTLQFNGYRTDILPQYWQDGWDGELNKIELRLTNI